MTRHSRAALIALVGLSFLVSLEALASLGPWLRASHAVVAALMRVAARTAVAHAHRATPAVARVAGGAYGATACNTTSYCYASGDDGEDAFGLIERGHDGDVPIDVGGADAVARATLRGERGPALWLVRGGETWIVRDPALVVRAKRALAPVSAIGREMGGVGAEMGRIGAREGAIGARMGRLGARLATLEARSALAASDPDARGADRRAAEELRVEMSRAKEEMRRADGEPDLTDQRARMRALTRRQREEIGGILDEAARGRRTERLGVGA